MRYLGRTLAQAAAFFGWHELANFAKHLPDDSATVRAQDKDAALFARDLQRAAILADIYDAVMMTAHLFAKAHGGKGAMPKPYPRPWKDDSSRIGKGAIPISEFDEWYYGGD